MDDAVLENQALEAMSPAEWESLCDGCGKCCMAKLEDEDTGEIYWTSVGCRLFDAGCRCTDYEHRLKRVRRLRAADARKCAHHQLAARDLRLPAGRRGRGSRLVAPADFRPTRDRARGRHFHARPRHRQRNAIWPSRRIISTICSNASRERPRNSLLFRAIPREIRFPRLQLICSSGGRGPFRERQRFGAGCPLAASGDPRPLAAPRARRPCLAAPAPTDERQMNGRFPPFSLPGDLASSLRRATRPNGDYHDDFL